MLATMGFVSNDAKQGAGAHISPKAEEFSYFYKFDDVKCYVANTGVEHRVSQMPIVHMWELCDDQEGS